MKRLVRRRKVCIGWTLCVLLAAPSGLASDFNEFKVKREEIFEFARKPTVTRNAG